MRIRTVEYRETGSFGSFQNVTVGMTAGLDEGDSPADAVEALKRFVQHEIAKRKGSDGEIFAAESRLQRLGCEAREIERNLTIAREKWEAARAFLLKHGVDLSDYDCPF